MDLTTLARVETHLESKGTKITSGGDAETLLSALIALYSASFERFMNRTVLAGATTEYFNVEPGQRVFQLAAYPVTDVTSVYHDTSREWTSGEIDSDNYYLDTTTGLMTIDGHGLYPGAGVLRAIYTGGMAANAAAFVVAFPEVAGAMDLQIVYHYGRVRALGATSVSGKDGSVTREGALDLLPTVKSALMAHRRMIVG